MSHEYALVLPIELREDLGEDIEDMEPLPMRDLFILSGDIDVENLKQWHLLFRPPKASLPEACFFPLVHIPNTTIRWNRVIHFMKDFSIDSICHERWCQQKTPIISFF